MQKVAVLFVAVASAVDVNVGTNSERPIAENPKVQKDAVVNYQERLVDQTDQTLTHCLVNDAFAETTFKKSFGNRVSPSKFSRSFRDGHFGQSFGTVKHATKHWRMERDALTRLYAARDARMDGQNHFPKLLEADEHDLKLVMSHQGMTISTDHAFKDTYIKIYFEQFNPLCSFCVGILIS